jgi:hypothetical protein
MSDLREEVINSMNKTVVVTLVPSGQMRGLCAMANCDVGIQTESGGTLKVVDMKTCECKKEATLLLYGKIGYAFTCATCYDRGNKTSIPPDVKAVDVMIKCKCEQPSTVLIYNDNLAPKFICAACFNKNVKDLLVPRN